MLGRLEGGVNPKRRRALTPGRRWNSLASVPKNGRGNGRLRALAERMDERYEEVEARLGALEGRLVRVDRDVADLRRGFHLMKGDVVKMRKGVRALRKETRLFTRFVAELDERFIAHKQDGTVHTLRVR